MRSNWFKAVLLSALMVTALIVPLITVSSSITAELTGSPAHLGIVDNYHIILKTYTTATQASRVDPTFDFPYEDNEIPLMVGKKVESGAVVAFGGFNMIRGGPDYTTNRWVVGSHDVLFDNVFQWMVPGGTKVLWYGVAKTSYYNVYADYGVMKNFIENMKLHGYEIYHNEVRSFDNIDNLGNYDILIIPQLQGLGSGSWDCGGNPDELRNEDVNAVKSFVEGGGGLLIMEQGDYQGYNFHRVQNKFLKALGFAYLFQNDTISDPENEWGDTTYDYPICKVDNTTWVGSAYENETDNSEVYTYSPCSIRPGIAIGVSVSFEPRYRNCLPGLSATFEVRVMNTSDVSYDNFTLEVFDNLGWATLTNPLIDNVADKETKTTTLTVVVPDNKELYRVTDNIVVTATSQTDNTVSHSATTDVYVCTWISPPMDDTEAVEHENYHDKVQGLKSWIYVGSDTTRYKNERTYLKFDLGEGLPDGYTIENARLYLYCFENSGAQGKNVQIYGLENDNWSEEELTWDYQPAGTLTGPLDTVSVTGNYRWYSWDVASFLGTHYPTDNIVSFLLKAENESKPHPDNFSYGFDPKEYAPDRSKHPYLAFGVRPVASYVTENHGFPGENVIVKAVINNRGALADNYDVTIENTTENWVVSPSATVLNNVQPGENREVQITATIPHNATPRTWENLILTVTSQVDENYASSTTDNGVWVGFGLHLVAGWNIVGFTGINENDTPSNMLPAGYTMKYYVAPYGPFREPKPNDPVENGVGYLVKVDRVWWIRTGVPPENHTMNLSAGWNIVSFAVTSANTTPANLFSGMTYTMKYYVAPYGPFKEPKPNDPVELGVGYLLKLDNDKTITVPL